MSSEMARTICSMCKHDHASRGDAGLCCTGHRQKCPACGCGLEARAAIEARMREARVPYLFPDEALAAAVDVALALVQEERERAAKKMVELAESRGHHGSVTVALFVEWCRRGDV